MTSIAQRIAVCSWSLQPTSPQDLAGKILSVGVPRVQLALSPLRESPEIWADTAKILRDSNIAIVSGMVSCIAEDYSTLDSIRSTGGIAPDATWEGNLANFRVEAALAAKMGLKLVTFHAGFFSHEDAYRPDSKMRRRLTIAADVFQEHGALLGLETGQETATELAEFLRAVNHPNLAVNFDPANMILYDKGDPVRALRTLAPWIRQVHIKDAIRTQRAGTWGEEVAAGSGEVQWPAFFSALRRVNYTGHFALEREAGSNRIGDLQIARQVVERAAC
jgi:sugar phosphate isomerase/epimerase